MTKQIYFYALTILLLNCSLYAARQRPLIFANYYVWYHNGEHEKYPWAGWAREISKTNSLAVATQKKGEPPISPADYPRAGLYDSTDLKVAEHHVKQAEAAGIDAFLISWGDTHKGRDKITKMDLLKKAF